MVQLRKKYMSKNIKQFIFVILVVSFGAISVINAAPTTTPPNGNIAEPVFGAAPAGAQSLPGIPAGNANASDVVPRVLSLGTTTLPTYGETLKVNGTTKVGSLTLASDALVVSGAATASNATIVQKTSTTTTDGKLIISSLATTSANRPLCIQRLQATVGTVVRIVLCPLPPSGGTTGGTTGSQQTTTGGGTTAQ